MIVIHPLHVRNARAQALLDALHAGEAPAALLLYTGTAPPQPGADAPEEATLQAVIELTQPAGSISGGTLTLTPAQFDTAVLADGAPSWTRLVDGAGAWIRDFSAGGPESGAQAIVEPAYLYTGGRVRANTLTLVEP